jgi:hypothetical protein
MTILHHQRKSIKLNTMEQYHICRATKTGKQLNELYTDNIMPSLKQYWRYTQLPSYLTPLLQYRFLRQPINLDSRHSNTQSLPLQYTEAQAKKQ